MKKLIFIIFLISFVPKKTFSQDSGIFLPIFYDLNSHVGFGLNFGVNGGYNFDPKFYLGIGYLGNMVKKGVGKAYPNLSPKRFPEDIYEIKDIDLGAVYATISFPILQNTIIGFKLGTTDRERFYNAYDNHHILSKNGNYYTQTTLKAKTYVGIFVTKDVFKFPLYVGLDNYTGLTLGITIK